VPIPAEWAILAWRDSCKIAGDRIRTHLREKSRTIATSCNREHGLVPARPARAGSGAPTLPGGALGRGSGARTLPGRTLGFLDGQQGREGLVALEQERDALGIAGELGRLAAFRLFGGDVGGVHGAV